MAKANGVQNHPLYGVHPAVAMVQKWKSELEARTGKSLEGWIALVKREGPTEEEARREWLKAKHKLPTNTASWIAERAAGKGGEEDNPESYLKAAVQYVDEQYGGAKAPLRPIYDTLLQMGRALGKDVQACPRRTIVPLYRKHVFAQIKPATNARIDLGFALAKHKGKLPARLLDTGGLAKKDRITHRIELRSVSEIDEQVKQWLKTAYDLDA